MRAINEDTAANIRRPRPGGVFRGARAQDVRAQGYMDVLAPAPEDVIGSGPATTAKAQHRFQRRGHAIA